MFIINRPEKKMLGSPPKFFQQENFGGGKNDKDKRKGASRSVFSLQGEKSDSPISTVVSLL